MFEIIEIHEILEIDEILGIMYKAKIHIALISTILEQFKLII